MIFPRLALLHLLAGRFPIVHALHGVQIGFAVADLAHVIDREGYIAIKPTVEQ